MNLFSDSFGLAAGNEDDEERGRGKERGRERRGELGRPTYSKL